MINDNQAMEKLQVLLGERGPVNKPQRAVRFADLAGVTNTLIPDMRSEAVTDTPTIEDYNALQADLAAIRAVVVALTRVGKS